jgi:hypothetical protein
MIKSKINTFGYWITPTMIVFISGIITLTFIYGANEKEKIITLIVGILFLILSFSQLIMTSKSIVIDTTNKTIGISHLILRQTKLYGFKEIDGYRDKIIKPARGRPFRVLYLVQNGKIIEEMSGFIYSNIDQIENGLNDLKYIGKKE